MVIWKSISSRFLGTRYPIPRYPAYRRLRPACEHSVPSNSTNASLSQPRANFPTPRSLIRTPIVPGIPSLKQYDSSCASNRTCGSPAVKASRSHPSSFAHVPLLRCGLEDDRCASSFRSGITGVWGKGYSSTEMSEFAVTTSSSDSKPSKALSSQYSSRSSWLVLGNTSAADLTFGCVETAERL